LTLPPSRLGILSWYGICRQGMMLALGRATMVLHTIRDGEGLGRTGRRPWDNRKGIPRTMTREAMT